ncbi:hypothetical protein Adt_14368 [Abeliophyllum distichum]|uniref:Uncharacterized protein n=1 Tax=Abeliophyllum distichum TaxID=126358 RepID=A0ABD1TZH1_9LAMI
MIVDFILLRARRRQWWRPAKGGGAFFPRGHSGVIIMNGSGQKWFTGKGSAGAEWQCAVRSGASRLLPLGVLVSHSRLAVGASLVSRRLGRQQTKVLHLEFGRRSPAVDSTTGRRQQATHSATATVVLEFGLLSFDIK